MEGTLGGIWMGFGTELREARQRSGMSLRDVERETGISNGYLSQLESDKIRHPSPHHLRKLADVLGVDYSTLMERAGYALPSVQSEQLRPPIRDLAEAAS